MVDLGLGEAEGLAGAAGGHVPDRAVVPFDVGGVDRATDWRGLQVLVDGFWGTEDNLAGYLDHTMPFVLFDHLDVEQFLRGHEPRFCRPTRAGLARWGHELTVDLEQGVGILVQLVGREQARHVSRHSLDLLEESDGVRQGAFADNVRHPDLNDFAMRPIRKSGADLCREKSFPFR